MGFLSASVTFTRFKILDDVSDATLQKADELLKNHAFQEIDGPGNAEERSFGWVNIDDFLDNGWHHSHPQKGHYLTFSLRLDTRRVPPAVFKKHYLIALKDAEAELKDKGRKFLSKDQKTELREQTMLKLRARTYPIPAVFDAVWNLRDHVVYFASARGKVCDMFMELFAKTFELHLDPCFPTVLAVDLLGESAGERIDVVEPADFTP